MTAKRVRKKKAASKSRKREVNCSVCKKPIPFDEVRKHHKVPRCTLSILGFRINAKWNLEPRHAECELPEGHEICELAKGFIDGHMWPDGFIERLAGKMRESLSDFALNDTQVVNKRDFYGKDPYGIIPLISRVPEEYLEWIPDLINPIMLGELLTIAPESVVQRVMKQHAESLPDTTLQAGKVLIPEAERTRFGFQRTVGDQQYASLASADSVFREVKSRSFTPA